jgi:hypothetical protein
MRLVPTFLFVPLHDVDHPVLPLGRVAPLGHLVLPEVSRELEIDLPAPGRLVRDLPQDVGEIVDRVDDLLDVAFLELLDAGVEREERRAGRRLRSSTL